MTSLQTVSSLELITIHHRFCGPPGSANGGYACGMLAGFIDGIAEVTLLRPPPLDVPMDVDPRPDGEVHLLGDGEIIAKATSASFDLEIPEAPTWDEAREASKSYSGFNDDNAFPTCFVCGPKRKAGDGLQIFAGNLAGTDHLAAPWIPGADLADENGFVKPEFIWSALDCPGGYAVIDRVKAPAVLGRMSAKIINPLRPGQPCIVMGWPILSAKSKKSRKHFAATALFTEEGKLIGSAKATWFVLDSAGFESED
ncbi:MAG: hypothetical protein OEY85_10700 [Rhodospirillales bacterium]|nr:hypothetical protein [Rhodospirillales bacterium]